MNILSISTLFPTPDMSHHGIFVRNRLAALHNISGVDVTVINPIPDSIFHRFIGKFAATRTAPIERREANMLVYHPRFFSIPGFFKYIEKHTLINAVRPLIKELNSYKPFDCIDVHWTFPDLPLAIELGKDLGIPVISTLRGMEAFYIGENDKRQNTIINSLNQTDKIISLSQEMAEHINRPDITSVIRNGVDTRTFKYKDKFSARKHLGLPSDPKIKIILGVGALIERKGFHHVINALSIAQKRFKNFDLQYHVLGEAGMEGNFSGTLETIAKDAGVIDRVFFQGKINNDQLPTWYNAADIFCLSSAGEGSPNVLTEALSCGTPAIANDVGAVSDIMNSEPELGITIDINRLSDDGKAQSIADAITHSLTHQHDRERQSDRMSKYTWDWCAQEHLKAIKEALGKKA